MVVNKSVVCAELDDESVLLDIESGMYFGLDAVGTTIWTMLAEGASEDAIAACLSEEYDLPASQIRADVDEFLQTLQSKGLVKQESPEPAT
jgi:PqqD family protein of HPr-rel-A system